MKRFAYSFINGSSFLRKLLCAVLTATLLVDPAVARVSIDGPLIRNPTPVVMNEAALAPVLFAAHRVRVAAFFKMRQFIGFFHKESYFSYLIARYEANRAMATSAIRRRDAGVLERYTFEMRTAAEHLENAAPGYGPLVDIEKDIFSVVSARDFLNRKNPPSVSPAENEFLMLALDQIAESLETTASTELEQLLQFVPKIPEVQNVSRASATESPIVSWMQRHWKGLLATVSLIVVVSGGLWYLTAKGYFNLLRADRNAPIAAIQDAPHPSDPFAAAPIDLGAPLPPMPFDASALTPAEALRELREMERQEGQLELQVHLQEKQIARLDTAVAAARLRVEQTQSKANASARAEREQSRNAFDRGPAPTLPGQRVPLTIDAPPSPTGNGAEGSRRGKPSEIFDEEDNGIQPNTDPPSGTRHVLFRFKESVSFIREATYEVWNIKKGQWERSPLTSENTKTLESLPNAPIVNGAEGETTKRITPLPLEDGQAPDGVRFPVDTKYSIIYDFYHQYYLVLSKKPSAPLRFEFDIKAVPPGAALSTTPMPESMTLMDTIPFTEATQRVIKQARKIQSFEAQMGYLGEQFMATYEYTLSLALSILLRTPPEHFVSNVDGHRVAMPDGKMRGEADCDTAGTVFAAESRELEHPSRLVVGLRVDGREATDWDAHGYAEVYNLEDHRWYPEDKTPPDRFKNGDEDSLEYQLPVNRPEMIARRKAEQELTTQLIDQDRVHQQADKSKKRLAEVKARKEALRRQAGRESSPLTDLSRPDVYAPHELMSRLTRIDEHIKSLKPDALPAFLEDPKEGLSAIDVELRKAGVKPEVRLRFLPAVVELVMRRMGPQEKKALYQKYLPLLTAWLNDPATMKPLIIDDGGTLASDPKKEDTPPTRLDAGLSFPRELNESEPMPRNGFARPGPTASALGETPRLVQKPDGTPMGFATSDQFFALQGFKAIPVIAPALNVDHVIGPIGQTADGQLYAVVFQQSSTGPGLIGKLFNVLTGKPVPIRDDAIAVEEVAFASTGKAYYLGTMKDGLAFIAEVGSNRLVRSSKDLRLAGVGGRVFCVVSEYTFTGNNVSMEEILPNGALDRRTPSSPFAADSALGLAMNPVSKNVFFYTRAQAGEPVSVFDFDHQRIQSFGGAGTLNSLDVYFEEDGTGHVSVIEAHVSTNYILHDGEQAISMNPALQERIIGRYGKTSVIEKNDWEKWTGFLVISDNESKQFALDSGELLVEVTPLGKDIYYRVFKAGQKPKERVLRAPQDPSVVKDWKVEEFSDAEKSISSLSQISGKVVFAEEKTEGQWFLHMDGGASMVQVRDVFPERADGSGRTIIFASVAGKGELFSVEPQGLKLVSSISHDVKEAYSTRDGLFAVLTDGMVIQYRKDAMNEMTDDPGQSGVRFLSDGYLYRISGGGHTLWRGGEQTAIHATTNSILDIYADRSGRTYSLEGSGPETLVTDFDGTPLGHNHYRAPANLPITKGTLYPSPDGTVVALIHHGEGKDALVRFPGAEMVAPAVMPISAVQIGPMGDVYYIENDEKLIQWKNGVRRIISRPDTRMVKQLRVARNGSGYYLGMAVNGDSQFVRVDDGKLLNAEWTVALNSPASFQFPARSSTGLLWMGQGPGSSAWIAHFVQSAQPPQAGFVGFGWDGTSETGDDEPRIQESRGDSKTAVAFVRGSLQGFMTVLLPDKEFELQLDETARMVLQNPSLRETEEWKKFQQAVIHRVHEAADPEIPARERLMLYLVTMGTTEETTYAAQVAALGKLPVAQSEARRLLASVITHVYQEHRSRFGEPFNPVGVKDLGVWSRHLNETLQAMTARPRGLRLVAHPTEGDLLKFNEQINELVRVAPWLQLTPDQVKDVWMSPTDLATRFAFEVLRQLSFWAFLFELLGFLGGFRVLAIQRKTRKHVERLIDVWVNDFKENVWGIDLFAKTFSLEKALNSLDPETHARLEPYMRDYRDRPTVDQATAFLLLYPDGIFPRLWTDNKRISQSFQVIPTPRAIRAAARTERVWKKFVGNMALAGVHPLFLDRIGLPQALESLKEIKERIEADLNLHGEGRIVKTAALFAIGATLWHLFDTHSTTLIAFVPIVLSRPPWKSRPQPLSKPSRAPLFLKAA
jgi:hypothetical protein